MNGLYKQLSYLGSVIDGLNQQVDELHNALLPLFRTVEVGLPPVAPLCEEGLSSVEENLQGKINALQELRVRIGTYVVLLPDSDTSEGVPKPSGPQARGF